MEKKVAIVQSCYIPWKGYFDLIRNVDEFILYDDVQYTKNDWRNRNIIKTSQGPQWLTIPVLRTGLNTLIKDAQVSNQLWAKKHWMSLITNYSKARFFKEYENTFEKAYLEANNQKYLSLINFNFITLVNKFLNIQTKITWSMDYKEHIHQGMDKTERVLALCRAAKATRYLSGPSATYMDEAKFKKENIQLCFVDYKNYIPYTQQYGEFTHTVSILDLIFNEGPNAIKYLKEF